MAEAAEAMKSPVRRTEPDLSKADFIAGRRAVFRDLFGSLTDTHHRLSKYQQTGN